MAVRGECACAGGGPQFLRDPLAGPATEVVGVQDKMKMQPLCAKMGKNFKRRQQSIKPSVASSKRRAPRDSAGCALMKLTLPSGKNDPEGLWVRSRSLSPGESVKENVPSQAPCSGTWRPEQGPPTRAAPTEAGRVEGRTVGGHVR